LRRAKQWLLYGVAYQVFDETEATVNEITVTLQTGK
jgi:hypothetical protein